MADRTGIEWTPGPWESAYPVVIDGVGYGQLFIRPLDESATLTMSGSGGAKSYTRTIATMKGNDADEANARLIAAAPELYEALNECRNAMRADNPAEGWLEIIQRAEAALDKAHVSDGREFPEVQT